MFAIREKQKKKETTQHNNNRNNIQMKRTTTTNRHMCDMLTEKQGKVLNNKTNNKQNLQTKQK